MENLDHKLSHAFADAVQRSPFGRKIADICASSLLWFFFGAFVYHLYAVTVQSNLASAALRCVPILAAWLVTLALEYAIGRRRPFQEQGKTLSVGMLWVPPSFPSGHATIAFALAQVFWNMGAGEWVVAVLAVAALISLGRVAVRAHYFTDVIAGAVVGWVVPVVCLRLVSFVINACCN